MDDIMDESPEDDIAPDPVQFDHRIDDNEDILDDVNEDEENDEEDPFINEFMDEKRRILERDEMMKMEQKISDMPEKTPEPRNSQSNAISVPHVLVYNGDAVNLDKFAEAYDSNMYIKRLEMVLECCPPLEKEAFIRLVTHLKEKTMNVAKYNGLYTKYEQKPFMRSVDVPGMDANWSDMMQVTSMQKLDVLLHELKKQKDEGVKESTRRAMEDLLVHYSRSGALMESCKLYNRGMREYCTQMKHIITMYVSWLETSVMVGDWHRVTMLITQSERALKDAEDAENQAAAPGSRLGRNQVEQVQAAVKNNRTLIAASRSKVNVIVGLQNMYSMDYRTACERFLQVDGDHLDGKWIVAPYDIARYGSLCALATLDRSEMKAKCLDSKFRKVLETEPMLVEALTCFTRSQFTRFFQLIDSIRDALSLDPFFYSQVNRVYSMIKKRTYSQYLHPYIVANLSTMASVFSTDVETLTKEVIELMDNGTIVGRLDEREGTIEMYTENERTITHTLLSNTVDTLCARSEYMILRALVQSNKIGIGGSGPDDKRSRGKRRTNDETALESGPTMFRSARTAISRIVRGGQGANEADSPSDGCDPTEPI